jgi:hypothetical protein
MAQMKRRVTGSGTAKPKSTPMPYKPSSRAPKAEVMPYKPSTRGGTSAGPVPSEISRGEQTRRLNPPSVDDKIYRTMPITEPQLKQIKKMYGIE